MVLPNWPIAQLVQLHTLPTWRSWVWTPALTITFFVTKTNDALQLERERIKENMSTYHTALDAIKMCMPMSRYKKITDNNIPVQVVLNVWEPLPKLLKEFYKWWSVTKRLVIKINNKKNTATPELTCDFQWQYNTYILFFNNCWSVHSNKNRRGTCGKITSIRVSDCLSKQRKKIKNVPSGLQLHIRNNECL